MHVWSYCREGTSGPTFFRAYISKDFRRVYGDRGVTLDVVVIYGYDFGLNYPLSAFQFCFGNRAQQPRFFMYSIIRQENRVTELQRN